jgi:glycosyltransferase involved in cell wall biosynthesis
MNDSISVIIPAYNEQESLDKAVTTVIGIVSGVVNDYEILIVNDGSTDTTKKIADRLEQQNTKIKVLHHQENEGIGAAIRDGIARASKTYITGFPADIDFSLVTYKNLLEARRSDCFVSSYVTNMSERVSNRKIISVCYTVLMNFIFGLKMRYYNGYFISPLALVKPLKLKSDGFTIFAEIKIKLIKKGAKFTEIPFETRPRLLGVSKALTVKSIFQNLYYLLVLIADIYL